MRVQNEWKRRSTQLTTQPHSRTIFFYFHSSLISLVAQFSLFQSVFLLSLSFYICVMCRRETSALTTHLISVVAS